MKTNSDTSSQAFHSFFSSKGQQHKTIIYLENDQKLPVTRREKKSIFNTDTLKNTNYIKWNGSKNMAKVKKKPELEMRINDYLIFDYSVSVFIDFTTMYLLAMELIK